jgi:hypothetical protein
MGISIRFTTICAAGILASVMGSLARAEDSVGMRFAQTFLGTCVQDFPNTDKIKAAAKTLGWKEIDDPNMKAMLGPSDSSATWQGWFVKVEESNYFVGISEGEYKGKKVQNCNVAQDRTKVDEIIAELEKLLKAKKISETVEAGQRYGTWEFDKSGEKFLIMTVDGTPVNFDLITVTIATDFRSY